MIDNLTHPSYNFHLQSCTILNIQGKLEKLWTISQPIVTRSILIINEILFDLFNLYIFIIFSFRFFNLKILNFKIIYWITKNKKVNLELVLGWGLIKSN